MLAAVGAHISSNAEEYHDGRLGAEFGLSSQPPQGQRALFKGGNNPMYLLPPRSKNSTDMAAAVYVYNLPSDHLPGNSSGDCKHSGMVNGALPSHFAQHIF